LLLALQKLLLEGVHLPQQGASFLEDFFFLFLEAIPDPFFPVLKLVGRDIFVKEQPLLFVLGSV
jgi:hypothetical protein